MEITTHSTGDLLEIQLTGMLDNDSASHVTRAVEEALRHGSHRVVLNLSGVSYLSSAGIAALLYAHKQLQAIRGFFGVCDPSPQVREVLRLTGLEKRLVCDLDTQREKTPSMFATTLPQFRYADLDGTALELYDLAPNEALQCRVMGNPESLTSRGFAAEDCTKVSLSRNVMGLGLGAFGAGFDDCRERFGEFLAVSGGVAQLPTHAAGAPDYHVQSGDFVPSVQVLYGLFCEGQPRHMARFEPSDETRTPVALSTLIDHCLSLTESTCAGFILIAESAGLIGASLRRSPAGVHQGIYEFPEIRRWLSFTPEHVHRRSLALVAGIAARRDLPPHLTPLAPFLRLLGGNRDAQGHFHVAVFSYRPMKKGRLDLDATVASLFESEQLEDVLHLFSDDREISGAGESEFVRGACWIGPINSVETSSPTATVQKRE